MNNRSLLIMLAIAGCFVAGFSFAQSVEESATITSTACTDCHETSSEGAAYGEVIARSAHDGMDCLSCHVDMDSTPHAPEVSFHPGNDACRSCHDDAAATYRAHGRASVGDDPDIPICSDCHGSHEVLPSSAAQAKTHPTHLPDTCGRCHKDLNLVTKHEILIARPIEVYEGSVHGKASQGGVYLAATCNDCHSANGSAHRILSPGHPDSSINHFNIPKTCGKCHRGVENDYWEGIHGQLARRGEADAPVCTHCHGEHGIISPSDPRSPVSSSRLAEATCSPCHDSAALNEKYGTPGGRLRTFVDSYHGLKTKAGDTHVANCASCHGAHRILPSKDADSRINPEHLQTTCGECHPGISQALAGAPIHGIGGRGLRTTAADVVEKIYIIAIVIIIGLMVLHWLLDLYRHLRTMVKLKPQVVRMRPMEVGQHTLLMVSFIVLVVSGFALRYSEGWVSRLFFGWEGGFAVRGVIHRFAAVAFLLTIVWHLLFIVFASRGRQFLRDIWPAITDFRLFGRRILYNLGVLAHPPRFGRFSYVEKAEYWALVWGTVVMIVTGALLWFDNWFIEFLPKGVLDVALVVHYWEAWLATLAVAVWHLYSTVFSPHVYPMNPSWLTGKMPDSMYEREHPDDIDGAREETEKYIKEKVERMQSVGTGPGIGGDSHPPAEPPVD